MKFTPLERSSILSGDTNASFRVLSVDNEADSLILRQKCRDVDFQADKELIQLLISRLKLTMAAESGVGIAAPQVGVLRNVFLFMRFDKPEQPIEVAINPRIVSTSPDTYCFERDGCLSVPDRRENTRRYVWIDVEYSNEAGKQVRERLYGGMRGADFTGVIFQHEFDHLQGVLYIDRIY